MATTLGDRLIRPRDAAELLGVGVRQLDRLVEGGVLAPVRPRPNANRRFRASDLARLVERGEDDA